MKKYLIISAIGKDRIGLVKELSRAILECDCNIIDSRMMVLGTEFAALIMVHGNWNTLTKLEMQLKRLEAALDLHIFIKRTEARILSNDVLPYVVEVVATSQPSFIHHLASFLASRSINIEEITARSYNAPHTGTAMCMVNLVIGIPANTHIAMFREELLDFCDDLNLDAMFEPLKGYAN